MRKITGRGQSAGLLELEPAPDLPRPKMYAETAHIPDPVLEDTAKEEADEPFFRARQRVSVRHRGGSRFLSRFSWKSRWMRAVAALMAIVALGLVAGAFLETKSLLLHDRHFILGSTKNIQITGNRVVGSPQVLAFFTADAGHSIFHASLATRQAELEQIRWVRRATVMRLWPNRLRVNILERTPIAFAREGNSIRLVDDDGVLLDLPNAADQHYSFPVLTGIASNDPPATRAARVELYRQFVQALDADGGHISASLSEVDLSDPEDVRAMFTGGARQPLVHFGTSDFLPRYRAYSAHLPEWLQQYPQLRSVDMRYGRQVVLDTGTGAQPPATPAALTENSAPVVPAAKKISQVHPAVASKAIAAGSKKRTVAAKKSMATKHHAAHHKAIHKHAPHTKERGHPVRKPLMHVVTGA